MSLHPKSFHSDFQLNGFYFTTVDEILTYSKSYSDELYHFLKDWFSDNESLSVFTSGSTGKPKQIALQKEMMINSAEATGCFFKVKAKTTALLCLPIHYIAGKMMLIRALTLGWHLDIVPPSLKPLENVDKKYGFSAMVPLQLENSLSKLDLIQQLIVGGGAVSDTLANKLQEQKTQVFATYGMTETITHIAIKKLNNQKAKPSFFNILPNVQIYKDDSDCLVINAPKVSERIVFTNDVVQLISDTQFKWLGRFDNVINSGGVKLHPELIEKALSSIIAYRFFVAGIPNEQLGQKLVLIIENSSFTNSNLSHMKTAILAELKTLNSLNKYELPKEIYFIDQFVETTSGKVQRTKTLQKLHTN